MQIQSNFGNFIAHEFLNVDNNSLAVYCKNKYTEHRKTQPKASCWLNLSDPEVKPLIDIITKQLNELHYQLGFRKDSRQEIKEAWINVGNNEYIDAAHSHQGWFFSGTYYVQSGPESGRIRFMTPIREMTTVILPEMCEKINGFNSSEGEHGPDPGKLIIWPSWLIHYVTQSAGAIERISIAFNTKIIMPEGSMSRYE